MDNQLYTAASGLVARQRQLDLIAHNLANAATTGFHRDGALFRQHLTQAADPLHPRSMVANSGVLLEATYMTEEGGPLRNTGGPLDLALRGQGFFAVETPAGVRYTRAGAFTRDAEGRLVTTAGHPVLDDRRREILLPPGTLEVQGDGQLHVGGLPAGQVGVFELPPQFLAHEGGDLVRPVTGFEPEPMTEPEVLAGYLEGSNVNPILELALLIETQRAFEAYQKLIHLTANEIDRRAIELGIPR
jgi:flagellar basal-body rod protein FlgF